MIMLSKNKTHSNMTIIRLFAILLYDIVKYLIQNVSPYTYYEKED